MGHVCCCSVQTADNRLHSSLLCFHLNVPPEPKRRDVITSLINCGDQSRFKIVLASSLKWDVRIWIGLLIIPLMGILSHRHMRLMLQAKTVHNAQSSDLPGMPHEVDDWVLCAVLMFAGLCQLDLRFYWFNRLHLDAGVHLGSQQPVFASFSFAALANPNSP